MDNWVFQFPYYVSEQTRVQGGLSYSIRKQLDPISFWGIRWIHGQKKLDEMSAKAWFEKEGLGSAPTVQEPKEQDPSQS